VLENEEREGLMKEQSYGSGANTWQNSEREERPVIRKMIEKRKRREEKRLQKFTWLQYIPRNVQFEDGEVINLGKR